MSSMFGSNYQDQILKLNKKLKKYTSEQIYKASVSDQETIEAIKRANSLAKARQGANRIIIAASNNDRDSDRDLQHNTSDRNYQHNNVDRNYQHNDYNNHQEILDHLRRQREVSDNQPLDNDTRDDSEDEQSIAPRIQEQVNTDVIVPIIQTPVDKTSLKNIIEKSTQNNLEELYKIFKAQLANNNNYINAYVLETFSILIGTKESVTNHIFQMIKMYPVYLNQITRNNQRALNNMQDGEGEERAHIYTTRKLMEEFNKLIMPKLASLTYKQKSLIEKAVKNTTLTTNLKALEKLYVTICVFCDIAKLTRQDVKIEEYSYRDGAIQIKRALEASECLGIINGIRSTQQLEKQVTQRKLLYTPNFFKHSYVIDNDFPIEDVCALKTEFDDANTSDKRETIEVLKEEEFACIERMAIRELCQNCIKKDQKIDIYKSKGIFKTCDAIKPILDLYNGVMGAHSDVLNFAHTSDIIRQRAIYQRNIASLQELKNILSASETTFNKTKIHYKYLRSKLRANVKQVRNIIENSNLQIAGHANVKIGQEELLELLQEQETLIQYCTTNGIALNKYNGPQLNVVAVPNALVANATPFAQVFINGNNNTKEHAKDIMEEIYNNMRYILKPSIKQSYIAQGAQGVNTPNDNANEQMEKLYNKFITCEKRQEEINTLEGLMTYYKEYDQMLNDELLYKEIRTKQKIEKIIDFYIKQQKKLENYIKNSYAISNIAKILEEENVKFQRSDFQSNSVMNVVIDKVKSIKSDNNTDVTYEEDTGIINNPILVNNAYWRRIIANVNNICLNNPNLIEAELKSPVINANRSKLTEYLVK